MVHIYYGRAGTGKTKSLLDRAAAACGKVCFVVPEQLSMTRERAVAERGLKGVTVLNFSRLADTIFRALGGTAKKSPDKAMSAAAVCLAIDRVRGSFCCYKSISHTHGFITKLIETFSDFDANRLTEKGIMGISDDLLPQMTRNKYRDLFAVYNEYKSLWTGEYKAPGDDMSVAAGKLELNDLFSDTVFMFDGFNGFTEGQVELIKQILLQARECDFAFTTDRKSDIFETVTREMDNVIKICKDNDLPYDTLPVGDICYRIESESLRHIERNLFETSKTIPKVTDNITVYAAKNISEELGFIACKIKNDVLNGYYRYRDIAVIVPDADAVSAVASAVFEKHGVPVFIDIKRTLLSKPLTAFVIHALEIAIDGFEFESVFSFLKTGLAGISLDDISILENYARMWRLKPRSWTGGDWTASPAGLSRADEKEIARRLEKLNSLKNTLVPPLVDFISSVRAAKTCNQMLVAVVNLLERFNVSANLEAVAQQFKNSGELQQYEDTLRVYSVFIDLLDSVDAVMGETKLSVRRFYDMLSVCASQVTVSSRPARADEVTFAGLGRVRAEGKKCVYIPRLNNNVIPAPLSDNSLITEADKRIFMRANIRVTNDFITSVARERFDFYSAVCSASKELVLSYSQFKITGEQLEKSEYLEYILALYDGKEQTSADLNSDFYMVSLSAASDLAVTGRVAGLDKAIGELIHFYPKEQTVDTALSDSTVSALYSKDIRLSFSGLDEYVECPFRFFLHRGLGIEETEIVEFDSRNIGTFIHKGLERLLMENDLTSADSETVQKQVDAISKEYYENVLKDCKNRSRRFDYLFSKAKEAFSSAAKNVVSEIQNSEFKPFDFEIDISKYIPPYDLGGGYTLTLIGSIDRVDKADADGKSLAKIIDYKSGHKSFSLKEVYNGHSMQLPIYAGAIRSKYGDVTISALYYIEVGVPSVKGEAEGMSDDEYKTQLSNCYVRDGVFLDGKNLELLEKSGAAYNITKENVIDSEGMNTIIDHALQKLYHTGCEITNGNTSVSPLVDTGVNACKYCKYGDICKIKSDPDRMRKFENVPDDFIKKEKKK